MDKVLLDKVHADEVGGFIKNARFGDEVSIEIDFEKINPSKSSWMTISASTVSSTPIDLSVYGIKFSQIQYMMIPVCGYYSSSYSASSLQAYYGIIIYDPNALAIKAETSEGIYYACQGNTRSGSSGYRCNTYAKTQQLACVTLDATTSTTTIMTAIKIEDTLLSVHHIRVTNKGEEDIDADRFLTLVNGEIAAPGNQLFLNSTPIFIRYIPEEVITE